MKANAEPAKIYFVNYCSGLFRIDPRNIIYIKAANNYCDIHLAEKTITVSSNLLNVYTQLMEEEYLVRVNRSYVVNICKITRILGNMVYMLNKERLDLNQGAIKIITEMVHVIR